MRATRVSSSSEAVVAATQTTLLEERHRRLHLVLIDAVLTSGSIPDESVLTDRLGMPVEAIRSGLVALAAADYLALDANGRVACLYPFSVMPTSHVVIIDRQRRHAMCAIDALGIPAMLGRAVAVEGRCAVCDTPIALRVRPGAIVSTTPPTTLVVARRDETGPAFAACCPFTVLVCGPRHAGQFMRRITGTHALSLPEALTRAEEIFGGLLAEAIPASRPRGKRWDQSRDA